MRTLSSVAQLEITTAKGIEPITLVGITWAADGEEFLYGDKADSGIQGRLLDISNFSEVIDIQGNSSVGEISVTLSDDENGTLKNIIDTQDIHKRPVTIYQWFTGLDISDKFPVFANGQINTPIVWDEGRRTLSFNVASKIEDKDVGPIVFGDCLYVPLEPSKDNAVEGKVITPFGIVDPVLLYKRILLYSRVSQLFAQYASIVAYDTSVMNLAPDANSVLVEYIRQIGFQDQGNRIILALIRRLEQVEESIQQAGNNPQVVQQLTITKNRLERNIKTASQELAQIILDKERIAEASNLIKYEQQEHLRNIDRMSAALTEIYKTNQLIYALNQQIAKQQSLVRSSIVVENGHLFPQGTEISLLINELKFTGTFTGSTFTFSNPAYWPKYTSVGFTAGAEDYFDLTDPKMAISGLKCLVRVQEDGEVKYHIISVTDQYGTRCTFELQEKITNDPETQKYEPEVPQSDRPSGQALALLSQVRADPIDEEERRTIVDLETLALAEAIPKIPEITIETAVNLVVTGDQILEIVAVSPIVLSDWIDIVTNSDRQQLNEQEFFVQGGTNVNEFTTNKVVYVANTVDSDIVGVFAYRTIDGIRALFEVPESYYTINAPVVINGVTIVSLTFEQRPSRYYNLGWEDTIYVHIESSVGPNPVDIIEWLIDNCTENEYDETSFDAVKALLTKYPCNFALLEAKNVIELMKDIAFQSRCALYLIGTKWHIKYLSKIPTSVAQIEDSDVLLESLSLEITDTESIVTKMDVTWRKNYLPESEKVMTLRNNIPKYGTQEAEYDFYCLTDYDLVQKSATFWLIRKSNSWKRINCSVPLTKLALEAMDAIELIFSGILQNLSCISIIEKADYDSSSNTISLSLWLPIRAGESEPYRLAYPSDYTGIFPDEPDMAGSEFDAAGIAKIILGTGAERPEDWGKGVLADDTDTLPESPTSGVTPGASSVRAAGRKSFPVPPYPDILTKPKVPNPLVRGPLPRETFVGVITASDNLNNVYDVTLETGLTIQAKLYSKTINQFLRTGTSCVVIRGQSPNIWWISGKLFDHETREVTVSVIRQETLECINEEGVTGIVAMPYGFRRTSYDGKQNRLGFAQTFENGQFRSCKKNDGENDEVTYLEEVNNWYQVGQSITIVKLPYGVVTPEGTTAWIDANVDGRSWEIITTIQGTVRTTRRNFGVTKATAIVDFFGPTGVKYDTSVQRIVDPSTAYIFYEEETVTAVFDIVNMIWVVVDHLTIAKFCVCKFNLGDGGSGGIGGGTTLHQNTSQIKLTKIKHWQGTDPADANGKVTVNNPYKIFGNIFDSFLAVLNQEREYDIVNIILARPHTIHFKTTAAFTKGGSVPVVVLGYNETHPWTSSGEPKILRNEIVYDDSSTFEDIGATAEGIAHWFADRNHYVIAQMWCTL